MMCTGHFWMISSITERNHQILSIIVRVLLISGSLLSFRHIYHFRGTGSVCMGGKPVFVSVIHRKWWFRISTVPILRPFQDIHRPSGSII